MVKKMVYLGVVCLLATAAVLTSARLVHSAEGENLLSQMGIPTNAKGVVILGQAAHLDWDWLNFFSTNVNNTPPDHTGWPYWNKNPLESSQPTDTIFQMATKLLAATPGSYGYHVCEMGFLQRFAQDVPQVWAQMKTFNPATFSIVGGGMTSPDNLLPHGEIFIRNYLAGMQFLSSENVEWSGTVWMPDDFGHDSQLPVLMEALGVKAVSFSRLPGGCQQGQDNPASGFVSAHHVLLDTANGGLNFNWVANDGSTAFVYYVPQGYCCGDSLNDGKTCESNSPHDASYCQCSVTASTPLERIQNKSVSIHTRNFHGSSPATTFRPTPYWTGFYASRADLKIGQYLATRTLQAAETFATITRVKQISNNVTQSMIDATWMNLSPSTHHDFITGTATDYVYHGEQQPLLARGFAAALSYKSQSLRAIVGKLQSSEDGLGLVVFNQLGLAVKNQLVTLTGLTSDSRHYFLQNFRGAVQEVSEDPTALSVFVDAPSLGFRSYAADELRARAVTLSAESESHVKVKVALDGGSVSLENSLLGAVISKAKAWSIIHMVDKKAPGGPKSILTGGNVLQWRFDGGNIYRYGFEEGCGFDQYNANVVGANPILVERGPLRTIVRVVLTMSATTPRVLSPQNYTIEYTLVRDEPFLRINVTGSTAGTSAVLSGFQFNSPIVNYTHGTTYHWDWKQPFAFGKQPDFLMTMEATHDFVAVMDGTGAYQGVIYHSATPSWGVLGNTLYGTLFRNAPGGVQNCNGYGADGTDTMVHSIVYAIRVPSTFSPAVARLEALPFNTPVTAIAGTGISSGSYSLASVAAPAIITAAKTGTFDPQALILRIYNPLNRPVTVSLFVDPGASGGNAPSFITALEVPVTTAVGSIVGQGNTTQLTLNRAVTTIIFN